MAPPVRESADLQSRQLADIPSELNFEYNLLERTAEGNVFALCEQHHVGVMAYSPIAGGKLSGKYAPGVPPDRDSRVALWPGSRPPSAAEYQATERLREPAGRQSVSPGAMALAWVLAHPAVTSAVVGPSRTPEHLRLAREALQLELDGAMTRQIAGWFESSDS